MKRKNPPCPHCGGHATRYGLLRIRKEESQKYLCTACRAYFSTFSRTIFFEKEYASSTVALAVELKTQHGLSLRQTQCVLSRFVESVPSTGTLSLWTNQLRGTELPRAEFSDVWHVDEVFIKHEQRLPDGKRKCFSYLWVVSDDAQRLIALHHSKNRDLQAAEEALKKARLLAGFTPKIIVSDDYSAYSRAVQKVLKGALHVKAHFASENFIWQGKAFSLSNNTAESLNSRLRDRLRRLRGLNKARSFLTSLQLVWNTRFLASLARALLQTINA